MTKRFVEIVRESMAEDPAFRTALHREALECVRSGDIETGPARLHKFLDEDVLEMDTTRFSALTGSR
jgi:hypothetical protein